MTVFYERGTYHAQILDVAMGESKIKENADGTKSGGNPQIVLRLKIISGLEKTSDGTEQSFAVDQQYDRTVYLTVTEKSKELVLAKLRWAGWKGERFETLASDLLGAGVRATCNHEESMSEKYRGQLTEKWDLELPPLESKPLENNPSIARKLNAMFGQTLKKTAAPKEAAKEAVAVAAGGPPPDDEIPF